MINRVDLDPSTIKRLTVPEEDEFFDVVERDETAALEEIVETGALKARTVQLKKPSAEDAKEDADSCEAESEEPISSWYVENEQGGLTPRWIVWADQVASFSETMVGKWAVSTALRSVGQKTGMAVGTMFPAAPFAYAAGKALAETVAPDSDDKSTVVQVVGVASAVAATAMTYGTPLGFIATTAGAIYGAKQGMEIATGQEVSPEYEFRTATSMATSGLVGGAVTVIDAAADVILPAPLSTPLKVAGMALNALSGTVGYYAPEIITESRLSPLNIGELVQDTAREAGGAKPVAAAIGSMISVKVITDLVEKDRQQQVKADFNRVLGDVIEQGIDSNIGANAFVRAVNAYAKILQDPEVHAVLMSSTKEDMKMKLIRLVIEREYGKGTSDLLVEAIMQKYKPEASLGGLFGKIVKLMEEYEVKLIGANLSSDQTREMLDIYSVGLLVLIPIYTGRERETPVNLSAEENGVFIRNLVEIALIPYADIPLAKVGKELAIVGLNRMLAIESFRANLVKTAGKMVKDMFSVVAEDTVAKAPEALQDIGVVVTDAVGANREALDKMAIKGLEVLPFAGVVAQMIMSKTIDERIGTNAFVRGLNEYANVIQDKTIQARMKELKECKDGVKKQELKEEIQDLINAKLREQYGLFESAVAAVMQYEAHGILKGVIKKVISMFKEYEIKFLGDLKRGDVEEDMLDVFLPTLVPMIAIYAKRLLSDNPDLTQEELAAFYGNIENIILSPYETSNFLNDVRLLSHGVAPLLMGETTLVRDVIAKYVEDSLKPKPSVIGDPAKDEEIKPSPFMLFLSYFTNLRSILISGYSWVVSKFVGELQDEIKEAPTRTVRRKKTPWWSKGQKPPRAEL